MAFGQNFAHGSETVPKTCLFKGKFWEPFCMAYEAVKLLVGIINKVCVLGDIYTSVEPWAVQFPLWHLATSS